MTGRDRLRELLDAVLDEENPRLDDMASDAFASSFHFSREVSRGTGESPVALRRRVMLERAAWRIAGGMSVTDAAWEAGYDTLEGFSRAFTKSYGAPPSAFASRGDIRAHWLAAPNGVHFHPPLSLWVHDAEETSLMHVAAQLFQHDLDDTEHLIELVKGVPEEDYRREVLPGQSVLAWDGAEPSAAAVLENHIWTKEVWTAAFEGADMPERGADDPAALSARHDFGRAALARHRPRHRAAQRVGRPADRRAV